MRTQPRELGRRLHTLGVIAGKLCSGSPNLSSDSGCTCHSMFGVGCAGSLFAKAPACEDGFFVGVNKKSLAIAHELDALGRTPSHAQPGNVSVDQHGEVFPMQHRAQEGVGRAPAPAALLVHLEVGAAEVVAVVEYLHRWDAAFGGSLSPGIDDLPAHARILDAHLAARAVAVG